MKLRENFPIYIEDFQFDKKIEITPEIHFDKIHAKIKAQLDQTKDWTKEQTVYPLHFEIVHNIDPDRKVYLDSNYNFIINNEHSHLKDLVNVAIFLNSDFKNLLNFAVIISSDPNAEELKIRIPPKRRVAQKTKKHLAISSESLFSYCGKHDKLTNDEFNSISSFIKNANVLSTEKKQLLVERIVNYLRIPIGPINRGNRSIRYLELVSILESVISDLGSDSLSNKFRSSFSALLNKYYGLDRETEKTLLKNIYSIRSILTHHGAIHEDSDTIKKYWKALPGANFDEKYNSALIDLEDRFKKILKVYLEKKITFQVVDVIED